MMLNTGCLDVAERRYIFKSSNFNKYDWLWESEYYKYLQYLKLSTLFLDMDYLSQILYYILYTFIHFIIIFFGYGSVIYLNYNF